jgi:hypothetical protein
MPELKLGLAPGKNGFFDPITNFYLTLDKPVQTLTFADHTQLEKITHALLATVPALVLYEGTLPQESIDAWKSKYEVMFRHKNFKNIVENGKVIGQAPVKDIVNVSLPEDGRVIEGNSAFDRADKLGAPGSGSFAGASTEEAEEVTFETAEAQEADTKEVQEETQEETTKKKSTRKAKAE